MQQAKNDEAPNTGKRNAGARGRRSHAEHLERRAAWERFFFEKNERRAAWERFRVSPAESRRERTAPKSENPKRAPRCMGTYFLKKIERRAAWERLVARP